MSRLVALGLSFASLSTVAAQGVPFGDDFPAAQEAARKDRKLVLLFLAGKDAEDSRKMQRDFDSNKKLADTISRKFHAVRLLVEDAANKATFKRFDADKLPTFVVLDSDGRILAREDGYFEPARFAAWIDTMIDLQSGLAMLEKADRTKPAAMAAAVRKIGAAITDRSYAVLVEIAENDELPDSVRKTAIEGLGKQKFGPEKLLGFLTHKSPTLKSAANNTMKLQGHSAAGALVEGLSSDNADLRVACWVLITSLNRDAKLVRDGNFWKSARPADREKAVAALREWLKPAGKE
jgi:thioredoxin-related protein